MVPGVHASKNPEKAAYIMAGSGRAVTYQELVEEANRIAHLLRELGYKRGDFPNAESAADNTIAIPIYPELSRDQLDYTLDCIQRFYS